MSKLANNDFTFKFNNKGFSLVKNYCDVGSGILVNGLYQINLESSFFETLLALHHNVGTKRGSSNEHLSHLWHKILGHISKKRTERLVKEGILPNLVLTDFGVCMDYIKGKQTKYAKKGATRSTQLLEIIYTDIYGPFDIPSFGGEKYFITFINDFSRYC